MNADPDGSSVTPKTHAPPRTPSIQTWYDSVDCWAEAREKIARMTLTIKLDRNWSSFQLANSTPPLSVTGSAIAPSARMSNQAANHSHAAAQHELGHAPNESPRARGVRARGKSARAPRRSARGIRARGVNTRARGELGPNVESDGFWRGLAGPDHAPIRPLPASSANHTLTVSLSVALRSFRTYEWD